MRKKLFLSIIISALYALSASAQNSLELPSMPKNLKTPTERAAYLSEHFWDALDFATDNRAVDSAFMEQTLVNYLSIMPHVPDAARATGLGTLFRKASVNPRASELLRNLSDEYLYSPASPMRNERLYAELLEADAAAQPEESATAIRRRELAKELKKNLPGDKARDFTIELNGGEVKSLQNIVTRPTLMLLYNPDCDTCREVIAAFSEDSGLNKAAADGMITILAVAIDTDREMWDSFKEAIPTSWLSGLDLDNIVEAETYYIPETPIVYLLSKEGNVIDRGLYPLSASGKANPALLTILLGGNNQ